MNRRKLAGYIDHTLLKADASDEAIKKLCREASAHGFAAVCINPIHVDLAFKELSGSPVKVCSVVGFPLGANLSRVKGYEAGRAVAAGADEVDMVINIGALKSGRRDLVENDIAEVVSQAQGQNPAAQVKVIIETCCLTDEEKVTACEIAGSAGAHFVKTSTGFGAAGADVRDIRLMRKTVGPEMGIKAAGGISSFQKALEMIEAGATRIGASAGLKIILKTED